MTFSIVAREGEAYGIAVASKFLAVGSVVPGARLAVGAVATQAMARTAYVPELLAALAAGTPAQAALDHAVAADGGGRERQVGIVGPDGAATHTGEGCMPWAGGRTGAGSDTAYAIQGNILTGPEVVDEMERAWRASDGQPFTRRLLAALTAGDAAGGDSRGRQSAAMYAVSPGSGYDGSGVLADLRVDDHPDAPSELARIHTLHELYFGSPENVRPVEGALRDEVERRLASLGHDTADLERSLERWIGEVNLKSRISAGGIDARVLDELRAATPEV